jgi:small subunit ribosomal protein S14
MAKLSSINKNNRRKDTVARLGEKRKKLKAQIMNKDLPPEERFAAQVRLTQMPRDSSACRIRNRCELTGRSRAYYRKFKLSRIKLRELGSQGLIPGLVKSSW